MTSIKLKGFARPLAGAIAVAALSLPRGPSQAQQFTMKFATLTLNDVQHENIKLYKEELEKVTGGRIKVEVYPAGQLGGAPRQTEGLRLGTIEAAIGPPELFFGADRRFQVLAMAGLFKDNEHARKVLDNAEFRKTLLRILGDPRHDPDGLSHLRSPDVRVQDAGRPTSRASPASARACWRPRPSRRRSLRSAPRRCRCRCRRWCRRCSRARSTASAP